jgi:DNA repair protein RadC
VSTREQQVPLSPMERLRAKREAEAAARVAAGQPARDTQAPAAAQQQTPMERLRARRAAESSARGTVAAPDPAERRGPTARRMRAQTDPASPAPPVRTGFGQRVHHALSEVVDAVRGRDDADADDPPAPESAPAPTRPPEVRAPVPGGGSLRSAIGTVLSRDADGERPLRNEFHPDHLGGRNQPVVLDEVVVEASDDAEGGDARGDTDLPGGGPEPIRLPDVRVPVTDGGSLRSAIADVLGRDADGEPVPVDPRAPGMSRGNPIPLDPVVATHYTPAAAARRARELREQHPSARDEDIGVQVAREMGEDVARAAGLDTQVSPVRRVNDAIGAGAMSAVEMIGSGVQGLAALAEDAGDQVLGPGGSIGAGALGRLSGAIEREAAEYQDRNYSLRPHLTLADVQADPSLGNLVLFGAEQVAQGAGSSLPILLSSLAGGPVAGSTAAYAMGTGDVRSTLQREGVDERRANAVAAVAGVPYAALERVMEARVARELLSAGVERAAASSLARPLWRRLVSEVSPETLRAMVTEGVTEAAQDVVTNAATAAATGTSLVDRTTSPAALRGYLESGVGGALGGAGYGAIAGAARAAADGSASAATTATPPGPQDEAISPGVEPDPAVSPTTPTPQAPPTPAAPAASPEAAREPASTIPSRAYPRSDKRAKRIVHDYKQAFGVGEGEAHTGVIDVPSAAVRPSEQVVDRRKVASIRRKIRNGSPLDPILVDSSLSVRDGHHRLIAAEAEGVTDVPVVVVGPADNLPGREGFTADQIEAAIAARAAGFRTPVPADPRREAEGTSAQRQPAAPPDGEQGAPAVEVERAPVVAAARGEVPRPPAEGTRTEPTPEHHAALPAEETRHEGRSQPSPSPTAAPGRVAGAGTHSGSDLRDAGTQPVRGEVAGAADGGLDAETGTNARGSDDFLAGLEDDDAPRVSGRRTVTAADPAHKDRPPPRDTAIRLYRRTREDARALPDDDLRSRYLANLRVQMEHGAAAEADPGRTRRVVRDDRDRPIIVPQPRSQGTVNSLGQVAQTSARLHAYRNELEARGLRVPVDEDAYADARLDDVPADMRPVYQQALAAGEDELLSLLNEVDEAVDRGDSRSVVRRAVVVGVARARGVESEVAGYAGSFASPPRLPQSGTQPPAAESADADDVEAARSRLRRALAAGGNGSGTTLREGESDGEPDRGAESVRREAARAETVFGSDSIATRVAREVAQFSGDFAKVTVDGLPSSAERLARVRNARQARAWVDIRGQQIESPEDVHRLLWPFRDPASERLHVLLLDDDGRVLSHTLESSGTVASVDPGGRRLVSTIVARARRLSATQVILGHNHPSGNPTPSHDDLVLSNALSLSLAHSGIGYVGMYVIDHTEGTLIESWGGTRAVHIEAPSADDWTEGTGLTLGEHKDVVSLLAASHRRDRLDIVYLNSRFQVLAVEPHQISALETIRSWLRAHTTAHGAASAVVVTDEANFMRAVFRSGWWYDDERGTGVHLWDVIGTRDPDASDSAYGNIASEVGGESMIALEGGSGYLSAAKTFHTSYSPELHRLGWLSAQGAPPRARRLFDRPNHDAERSLQPERGADDNRPASDQSGTEPPAAADVDKVAGYTLTRVREHPTSPDPTDFFWRLEDKDFSTFIDAGVLSDGTLHIWDIGGSRGDYGGVGAGAMRAIIGRIVEQVRAEGHTVNQVAGLRGGDTHSVGGARPEREAVADADRFVRAGAADPQIEAARQRLRRRFRPDPGAVEPAVVETLARTGIGAAVGGAVGATVGDPVTGAFLGASAAAGGPALARLVIAEAKRAVLAFGSERAANKVAARVASLSGRYATVRVDGLPSSAERLTRTRSARVRRAWVDIRGQEVREPADLHRLLAPFRDPRAERLHVVLLDDDGRVLSHTMESSGAINYVDAGPIDETVDRIRKRAARVGATRFYMAHNHPSGDPTPSDQDHAFRREMRQILLEEEANGGLRFEGMYVIDHDTGVLIPTGGGEQRITVKPGAENAADWTALGAAGFKVKSPEHLGDLFRFTHRPDRLDIAFLDTSSRVVAYAPHQISSLETMPEWLPQHIRGHSAHAVAIVTDGENFDRVSDLVERIRQKPDNRVVEHPGMKALPEQSGRWNTAPADLDRPVVYDVVAIHGDETQSDYTSLAELRNPEAFTPHRPIRSYVGHDFIEGKDWRGRRKLKRDKKSDPWRWSEDERWKWLETPRASDPGVKTRRSYRLFEPGGQGNAPAGLAAVQFRDAVALGRVHHTAGGSFDAWSDRMVDDVGEDIRPHLRAIYSAITAEGEGETTSAAAPASEPAAPGRIQVAPLPGGEPRAPSDMVLDLSKGLKRRIEVGKPGPGGAGRSAAGMYYSGSARTVVRALGDLDTTAHEVAHALDDRYGVVADWVNEDHSPFDQELIPAFSRHGSAPPADAANPRMYERAEGVAEWIRAWIVNPDAADAAAPRFAAHFRDKVPPAALAALRDYSRQVREFAGLSPLQRTLANIETQPRKPTLAERWKEERQKEGYPFKTTAMDKLSAAFIDQLAPVYAGARAARRMRRMGSLIPENDPEVLFRLLAGANDKVEDVFNHGPVNARLERVPGLGGVGWLIEPLDASSKETLDKEIELTMAMLVSERAVEKAAQFQGDVREQYATWLVEAEQLRQREQRALDREAKRLRERARVRAGRVDRASAALDKAREQHGAAAARTGTDIERTGDALSARAGRLRSTPERSASADRREIGRRMGSLRRRTGERADRTDRALQGVAERQEGAREFGVQDVEKEIARRQEALDARHTARLARIGRKRDRLALEATRHAATSLTGVGGGIYRDDETALGTLSEIGSFEADRRARLAEAARRYREWANAILRYMVEKGRMSEETYQAIVARNQQYAAMQRVYEEGEGFRPRASGRLASARAVIERFVGSRRKIGQSYANLLMETEAAIKEADRNEAMRTLTDLLRSDRGMHQGDAADLAEVGRQVEQGTEGAVRVYRDGEVEYWKFEEGIEQALRGWEASGGGWDTVMAVLSTPARLQRWGVTHNPAFAVRNIQRDAQQRTIVSRTGSKPWDSFRRTSEQDLSRFFLAGGGQFGNFRKERVDYYRDVRRAIDKAAARPDTIVTSAKRLAGAYGEFLHWSELSGRLAEARSAERHAREVLGYDEYNAMLYAAVQARDLLDFARNGYVTKRINQLIPFTNANVQGLNRTYRGARENPRALAIKWALWSAAPALAVYALAVARGEDDLEEYRQLPAYLRDFFFNIKIGPDNWLRIPKSFEYGVAATAFERALDRANGNKNAFDGLAPDVFKVLVPIEPSALIGGPFKSLVEQYANYDFFRGRPIIPPTDVGKAVELRKNTEHASRFGRAAQELFGIDGRRTDFFVSSTFGGVGQLALNATDIGRADENGEPLTWARTVSGVLATSPAGNSEDVAWVEKRAQYLGLSQNRAVRELRAMKSAYFNARGSRARDEAARELRGEAARVRTLLEQITPEGVVETRQIINRGATLEDFVTYSTNDRDVLKRGANDDEEEDEDERSYLRWQGRGRSSNVEDRRDPAGARHGAEMAFSSPFVRDTLMPLIQREDRADPRLAYREGQAGYDGRSAGGYYNSARRGGAQFAPDTIAVTRAGMSEGVDRARDEVLPHEFAHAFRARGIDERLTRRVARYYPELVATVRPGYDSYAAKNVEEHFATSMSTAVDLLRDPRESTGAEMADVGREAPHVLLIAQRLLATPVFDNHPHKAEILALPVAEPTPVLAPMRARPPR